MFQPTCPCKFIMTTVLLRLQTTKCSGFLAKLWILFIGVSPVPKVLKVFIHSVVLMLHTFTVPSDDALKFADGLSFKHKFNPTSYLNILCPSCVNIASFTNELCPLNSLSVLPDFKPCILKQPCQTLVSRMKLFNYLIMWSKDALSTWLLSLENCKQVMPFECAFSILRKHWPVIMRHTLIRPACDPVTSISLSRENAMHKTACSIIMKLSWNTKNR